MLLASQRSAGQPKQESGGLRIFPSVEDVPESRVDELSTDYGLFSNSASVDDDSTATVDFEKHAGPTRLKAFEIVEETPHKLLTLIKSHSCLFVISTWCRLASHKELIEFSHLRVP